MSNTAVAMATTEVAALLARTVMEAMPPWGRPAPKAALATPVSEAWVVTLQLQPPAAPELNTTQRTVAAAVAALVATTTSHQPVEMAASMVAVAAMVERPGQLEARAATASSS
jgi:hypothetical protein